MSTYAITKLPAPLYNTPHFQLKLKKDNQGLLKSIETIALPFTKFTVVKKIDSAVSEVTTTDYPSSTPLYIDSRFLVQAAHETPERKRELPSSDAIIEFLQSVVGVRYFWGGNWAEGIPEMAHFYRDLTLPDDDVICKGVDCSGLLYQATNGFTPRNTSQLVEYGQALRVNYDSLIDVQKAVKPLDMMVWRGHVIFILDSTQCIESTIGKGVIISDFLPTYTSYRDKLRGENKPFSLRRWHPDFLT